MAASGQFALLLAFFLSAYAVFADIAGSWRGDSGLIRSARNATIAGLLCLTVATIALLVLLLRSDFSVIYVADHTSLNLPLIYKISAFWAGVGGSLLFWLWLQVAFIVVVYCTGPRSRGYFAANARVIINLITVFFLLTMINDRNPFETYPGGAVEDGAGLNPLLQHPAMALHPPTLFIGYAAFMVPFGWAYAWLKTSRPGRTATLKAGLGRPVVTLLVLLVGIVPLTWLMYREVGWNGYWALAVVPFAWAYMLVRTPADEDPAPMLATARNWTIGAWLFLTAGIVLGGWWAYEELGWGGYWAWDPVENASLLPWLTSTALLHCFRMYKSRGAIAVWTVVLAILTFSLCVLGRFLTKSGLVASVHAFPEPGLSLLYIVLLVHLFVIAGGMIGLRYAGGGESAVLKSPTAHKYVILNNWLLVFLLVVILLGTLMPFLTQVYIRVVVAITGKPVALAPITLEPSFFTKITAPAGLFLLFLIGACPHLVKRGFNFSWRVALGVVCLVASAAVWLYTCSLAAPRPPLFSAPGWAQWLMGGSPAIPFFILSGYMIVVLAADFAAHEIKRARAPEAASPRSLRWYGARIVHLGVAIMFVGIAGSGGYKVEEAFVMRPGDKAAVKDYELTYDKLEGDHGPNYNAAVAVVSITKDGRSIGQLRPAKAVYSPGGRTLSEVDIRRTLAGDLYLAVTDVNVATRVINLRVMIKPLINWIWIGSLIMAAGTIMVMAALFRPRARTSPDSTEVVE